MPAKTREDQSMVWFWVFLIIAIFVIYFLALQRPYCQTLTDQLPEKGSRQGTTSGDAPDQVPARYKTPELFGSDNSPDNTAPAPKAQEEKKPGETNPAPPSVTPPPWLPKDTSQHIVRPDTSQPRPFGYDLFATQDRDPVDAYANVPDEYKLGTGDHLLVNVWGRVDLELELTIDRAGRVFIPRAGQVTLAGMSLGEAKNAIRKQLETVYSRFEMSVTVGELRTFRVFVFGEVRRPGAYTVGATATLVDALYRAGGPNERGTLRRVRLVRGDSTTYVDLYDFLLTGRRGTDPHLASGDVVFVDVTGPRTAIRGRVKRPGIYELNGPETLRDCIDLAGGFEADAYRDRIMIDRLQSVDGRELVDVNLSENTGNAGWSMPIRDGDDISVFSMLEARPNLVWLDGWVKHPGAFERTDSMTIGRLIDYGSQLLPGTFLARADLVRANPDGKPVLIAVSLESVVDGDTAADLRLRDGDRLTVYAQDQVERPHTVSIEGEVNRPGPYALFESMRLSDLVFRAGSTTREALADAVEVARRMPDGKTQTIRCNLDTIMRHGDLAADILLRDGDMVFVRRDPNFGSQRLVTVEGEVRFPGRYALQRNDETFYDVLMRTGGLTDRAFARGTVFVRQEISSEIGRQNLAQILVNAQPLVKDSTGQIRREGLLNFDPAMMTRIVLDVPAILSDKGGDNNVVMRPGDHVFVPALPSGIQVLGSVAAPGTIRYSKGWRLKDYVGRAGGASTNADLGSTRLVRADGQVIDCRHRNMKVELGDAVFVPPRVDKKTDWLKTITQTVSVVGGVATTYLVVHSLAGN